MKQSSKLMFISLPSLTQPFHPHLTTVPTLSHSSKIFMCFFICSSLCSAAHPAQTLRPTQHTGSCLIFQIPHAVPSQPLQLQHHETDWKDQIKDIVLLEGRKEKVLSAMERGEEQMAGCIFMICLKTFTVPTALTGTWHVSSPTSHLPQTGARVVRWIRSWYGWKTTL